MANSKMDRRDFLQKTAIAAGGAGLITTFPFVKLMPKSMEYPFMLGVASGDPHPDGVVLWTRLAPRPLAGGGMGTQPVDVDWELSEDKSFHQIVKKGRTAAEPQFAHSVHVEVDGLEPEHWYYYRFKAGHEHSPIGRTKTAPAPDADLKELTFAFASCQKYKDGFYNAYDHLVNENIDVVFFLGDYIYEGAGHGHIGRGHLPQKSVRTLQEYRIRYGQYKSDLSLQAAHAAFPWIVTLDDHDIEDNWAGDTGNPEDKKADFLARRAAAFQAYYEHMPLRTESIPENIDMQLYRRFAYGNLIEFNVLDTRQYRTNYACGTSHATMCAEVYDPSRTMLGHEQEQWLFGNLKQSKAHWNVLPQQVMMAEMDIKPRPIKVFHMDHWDGYIATRNRLFKVVKQNDISNMIVLTGDMHRNMVNNLLEDFDDPNSPILGTEFIGTSITSNGDGKDQTQNGMLAMKANPFIKFFNAQRGYVRCTITRQEMRADFRVVPYVSRPGAPIKTRASFKVINGQPGANQV